MKDVLLLQHPPATLPLDLGAEKVSQNAFLIVSDALLLENIT
jgi:hypothetical protein